MSTVNRFDGRIGGGLVAVNGYLSRWQAWPNIPGFLGYRANFGAIVMKSQMEFWSRPTVGLSKTCALLTGIWAALGRITQ